MSVLMRTFLPVHRRNTGPMRAGNLTAEPTILAGKCGHADQGVDQNAGAHRVVLRGYPLRHSTVFNPAARALRLLRKGRVLRFYSQTARYRMGVVPGFARDRIVTGQSQ